MFLYFFLLRGVGGEELHSFSKIIWKSTSQGMMLHIQALKLEVLNQKSLNFTKVNARVGNEQSCVSEFGLQLFQ